jgi:hypothetical protein
MRKISSTLPANDDTYGLDGSRPVRVPGATITAWNSTPEIDLGALFSRSTPGATVTGGALAGNKIDKRTIQLTDGTKITFSDANHMEIEDIRQI